MAAAQELITAYWEHYRLSTSSVREDRARAADHQWAWEAVEAAAMASPPDEVIGLLRALADAAPSDEAVGYLGAGPLEQLLVERAVEVVDAVDEAARQHPRFRVALTNVWLDDAVPEAVVARLRRFMGADEAR